MNESNLQIETWPPHKIGGQNVGVISTGVKIEHLPTGIVAISNAERSQHKNKKVAMEMIRSGLEYLSYEDK